MTVEPSNPAVMTAELIAAIGDDEAKGKWCDDYASELIGRVQGLERVSQRYKQAIDQLLDIHREGADLMKSIIVVESMTTDPQAAVALRKAREKFGTRMTVINFLAQAFVKFDDMGERMRWVNNQIRKTLHGKPRKFALDQARVLKFKG